MAKLRSFNLDSKTDVRLVQGGFLLLLCSSFLLMKGTSNQFFPEGIIPIGEIKIEGKVHRRFSKALNWVKIKGSETVFSKDLVYTPKDSSAEVILENGVKLILEPSSLVEFDPQSVKDKFGVVLIEGKGKLVAPGAKSPISLQAEKDNSYLPMPKYEAPALLPEPEIWNEEQNDLGHEFEAARGASLALLSESSLPDLVEAVSRLTDFELVLKEPRPGVQRGPYEFWFELEWNPVPISEVSYELEVSRSPDFAVSFKYSTQKNLVEMHLVDSGHYYWRVVSRKEGDKISSKTRSFVVSNASKTITPELSD